MPNISIWTMISSFLQLTAATVFNRRRLRTIWISGLAFALSGCFFISDGGSSDPDPEPEPEPQTGILRIQLDGVLDQIKTDTEWLDGNIDTYRIYAFTDENIYIESAEVDDASVNLEVNVGTYHVALLAGDEISDTEAYLLAAGEKDGIVVSLNLTTDVAVNLKPSTFVTKLITKAEKGRQFAVQAYGTFPIEGITFEDPPSVILGSEAAVVSTTVEDANWSLVTQFTAPIETVSKDLTISGNYLTLDDDVVEEEFSEEYRWKFFAGTTSPYATQYTQTISFEDFTTVCASGCDYSSIQTAINNAANGDNIAVRVGTYNENLVINRPLTLYGATWDRIKDQDYEVPEGYGWNDSSNTESLLVTQDPDTNGNSIDIQDTDDVTFKGFVIHSLNTTAANRHLLRLYALNQDISNIEVSNNVIGPNTKIGEEATYGRMGLYMVPHYGDFGILNTEISHNKIFGSGGNGNNIFIWGGYIGHDQADLAGTVIEYNDIHDSRRSGIEISGGAKGLTIQHNKIHDNGFDGDDADGAEYKYGNGIVFIRLGSESGIPTAFTIDNMTIQYNQIYNNKQFGIYMGPKNTNHVILGNDLYNNAWDAVQIDLDETYHGATNPLYDVATGISLTKNNIYDNGHDVSVIGSPTNSFEVDASDNWWGSDADPSDNVSSYVDSSNWASSEYY